MFRYLLVVGTPHPDCKGVWSKTKDLMFTFSFFFLNNNLFLFKEDPPAVDCYDAMKVWKKYITNWFTASSW